ncbi:MAG: hypothetical protein HY815_10045 [Candidatus Riflebacteria bacterium]|nr:hypothetical protein [Candidatus Riflebacteria bacterium]
MAKEKKDTRPLFTTPEEWLDEILAAWDEAGKRNVANTEPYHLASVVCLKFRGRQLTGPRAERVAKIALANYHVNTDRDTDTARDIKSNPRFAFALCYLASHLALDLVEEYTIDTVIEHSWERLSD